MKVLLEAALLRRAIIILETSINVLLLLRNERWAMIHNIYIETQEDTSDGLSNPT